MRFEVNGQSYMLTFNQNDGRWYLLTPTRSGVKAIPVINDDELGFVPQIVVPVGDAGLAGVN